MSYARSSVLVACATTLALSLHASAQQAPRAMTVVDLIEMPSVGDPQLSPDGRQLLFTRSTTNWEKNRTISHVWRIDVDGSNELQLTRGDEGQSSPRWSPDGSRIAFLADRADDEPTQIHLLRALGGEAEQLTKHPTSVSSIQWSPDGARIYFQATDEKSEEQQRKERERDDVYAFDENYQQRHVWRVAVTTGEAERVTEGDFSVLGYTLSRDGTMIAHHRSPSPLIDDSKAGEVWVMASDGSGARRLTDNGVAEGGAELSPDNSRVVFTSGSSAEWQTYFNDNVFVVPAAGGAVRELVPQAGFDMSSATWSFDGSAVFVLANTGVRDELFRIGVESGQLVRMTGGDHALGGWSYAPAQDRHVFTRRTSTSPGDVWLLSEALAEPTQITHVFDDVADRFRLPREEAIQWQGADGVTVEGLLFYPLDYREGQRYPLIVQTHGGPASSDQFGEWSSTDAVQVYAWLGYFVLKPNYRGSTGYGDDFLRDMVGGYFRQAHLDVMAGVDHLIERGMVDGARMGKMGWSAGGHMTNKIITHTDRFRAAASGAGAANWLSMYAQSDVRTYRTPWFGGTPWTEGAPIDVYWEHSPLREVWKVSTPTLFLVGEEDPRVPMPQSVEMYRGVKAQGVPTHLYVAPREPHGWRELRHRLFLANVHFEWFERWIMEREWSWETVPEKEKKAVTDGG